jgi:uncharacterized protein (UPF0261 family)
LNKDPSHIKILIPLKGWSEADREEGPLYDPPLNLFFTQRLREKLDHHIQITQVDHHINDAAFAEIAAQLMHQMIREI